MEVPTDHVWTRHTLSPCPRAGLKPKVQPVIGWDPRSAPRHLGLDSDCLSTNEVYDGHMDLEPRYMDGEEPDKHAVDRSFRL